MTRRAASVQAARWLRPPATRCLPIVAVGSLAAMLFVAPVASAASDVFSNIAPAQQVSGGLFGEFPLGNYALDSHFSAVSVGLFSGINVSGTPPMIAYFLANTIWQLTAFLANSLITVFTWAFSLDLLNGSSATNGAGALAPVSAAVQSIYSSVLGPPWLVVAIVITGLWAMWKALVQRRYTETAGALGLSVVFVVIALLFVTQPAQTIGSASKWTNEMSAAFLSLTDKGTLDSEQQAKQADADQLFQVLVYDPWVVLQFGGLEHCVTSGTSNSVPVQPLPTAASRQLLAGTEIQTAGKTCINNANKYAAHFLRYQPDSDDRNSEYNALNDGKTSELPSSDPAKASGAYQLGAADRPATDAMGEDGQYQRLLLAVVIFGGELGVFLLLGVLSAGVILAQIIVLLLLAFSPVALVMSVFPGRGHEFFIGWLQRLATFLLRKAIYSLILAVTLAVASALVDATTSLGWLLSFLLEAAFFWAVFLYRHQLTGQLARATTGHDPARDRAAKLASLYYGSRLLRGLRGGSRSSSSWSSPGGPPPASDDPPTGGPGSDGPGGPPLAPDSPPSAGFWEPEPTSPRLVASPVAQLEQAPAQVESADGPRLALPAPAAPDDDRRGDQPLPTDPLPPTNQPTASDPSPPARPRSSDPPSPGHQPPPEALRASSVASDARDASPQQPVPTPVADRDRDTRSATSLPADTGEPGPAGEQQAARGEHEASLAEQLRTDRERLSGAQQTTDLTPPVLAPEEESRVTGWVRALLGRQINDRDRQRLFICAAAVVLAAALLLLAVHPDHARDHVTARRSAVVSSAAPWSGRTRPAAKQTIKPPPAPSGVTGAASAFLGAYLPYLYGHPRAGLVPAATAALRRELAHQALVVPPAQSRLRARVVSLTATPNRAGDWMVRALIADGGVADYPIILTLERAGAGRWLVSGVSG